MSSFPYALIDKNQELPSLGLVVLQADETIEDEFKTYFPPSKASLLVSRVPSGLEVTTSSLTQMETTLQTAASLFPQSAAFDVVGYACTSGTATIGSDKIAALINAGCLTKKVTEPVSAVLHLCQKHSISNIALLSPYVEEVSNTLRSVLGKNGVTTSTFGSFNEAEEARVAQIDARSIINAAVELGRSSSVESVFISCTNLKTLGLLAEIEQQLGKPVFSSNSALAAHMSALATI